MEKNSKSSGSKIILSAFIWAVVYISCMLIVKKAEPSRIGGLIISFIPAIAFLFFIKQYIRGIALMDEVERRIQLEAVVWGFSLGILLLMILALLDFIFILNKAVWGYTYLIGYFFAFYLFGIFITRRKYHSK